jgi:protein CpxP
MKTGNHVIRSFLIVLGVAVITAAPALAQWGGMGHGRHHGPHDAEFMLQHMATELELTDEQVDQAHQILDQHKIENETARESVRAAHDTLADLMHADSFDETAIRVAAEELAAAQTEMIVAHAMVMRDLRDLLTPEQLDRFEEMRQMHRGAQSGKGQGQGNRGHGYHKKCGQNTN